MTRAAPYNREAALDAAMRLFWQKGFHATSLKDLEGVLQMKPGSIYAAFKSKEDLYLATLEKYALATWHKLRDMRENSSSPLTALSQFMKSFGRQNPEDERPNVCMILKTMLNATAEEGRISEAAHTYLDMMADEMTTTFQAAIDKKEISPDQDPARLARRYQMNLTALTIQAQRENDPIAILDLTKELTDEIEALRIN